MFEPQIVGCFDTKTLTDYLVVAERAIADLEREPTCPLRLMTVVLILGNVPEWLAMDRVRGPEDRVGVDAVQLAVSSFACQRMPYLVRLREHANIAKHCIRKRDYREPASKTPRRPGTIPLGGPETTGSDVTVAFRSSEPALPDGAVAEWAKEAIREAKTSISSPDDLDCGCLFHEFLRAHPRWRT